MQCVQGFFVGGKTAGVRSWPLTSTEHWGYERSYTSTPPQAFTAWAEKNFTFSCTFQIRIEQTHTFIGCGAVFVKGCKNVSASTERSGGLLRSAYRTTLLFAYILKLHSFNRAAENYMRKRKMHIPGAGDKNMHWLQQKKKITKINKNIGINCFNVINK